MIYAEPDNQELRANKIKHNLMIYASNHFHKWYEIKNKVSCGTSWDPEPMNRNYFDICTNMREISFSIIEDLQRLGYKVESIRSSQLENDTIIISVDSSNVEVI